VRAQNAAVSDRRIIYPSARAYDDQVRELAPSLDLKCVPRAEQVRFLLLVLEEVDDEVDDRCCCIEVAIERVPNR